MGIQNVLLSEVWGTLFPVIFSRKKPKPASGVSCQPATAGYEEEERRLIEAATEEAGEPPAAERSEAAEQPAAAGPMPPPDDAPPVEDLAQVLHELSLVEKKHWCFYDDSGPHQRPVGYVHPIGKHLQARCTVASHRDCRLWLSCGEAATMRGRGLISVVRWLAAGRNIDETKHAAAAYDLKVSYGMRPRGPRPGGGGPSN